MVEGDSFDACSGHQSPELEYHYHVAPSCLLDQLGDHPDHRNMSGHSPMVGWAFDGFPIYGPHGLDGQTMYGCNPNDPNVDTADCVDECNGHSQHEIDGFKYHYHMLGPLGDLESQPLDPVPSPDFSPYTIGCLRGIPSDWSVLEGLYEDEATFTPPSDVCLASGTVDGFVAQAVEGMTDIYGLFLYLIDCKF